MLSSKCACKKFFWYVDHCFGNDCSERKPYSTSFVCCAHGTHARAVLPCKSCFKYPQQGPQLEHDSNGKQFSEKTRIGLDGCEEERHTRRTWLTWKTPSAVSSKGAGRLMWQQAGRGKWEKLLQGTDAIGCAMGRHDNLFREIYGNHFRGSFLQEGKTVSCLNYF